MKTTRPNAARADAHLSAAGLRGTTVEVRGGPPSGAPEDDGPQDWWPGPRRVGRPPIRRASGVLCLGIGVTAPAMFGPHPPSTLHWRAWMSRIPAPRQFGTLPRGVLTACAILLGFGAVAGLLLCLDLLAGTGP